MKFFFLLIYFSLFSNILLSADLANGLRKIDDYKIVGPKNFLEDFKTFQSKNVVNVVVEIPKGTNEKWEVSKTDGSLEHDFFQGRPRVIENKVYIVNYGMIPRTILPLKFGGDGDPVDAILLGEQVPRGSIIQGKIIGVMKMRDMDENDDKIILTSKNSVYNKYKNIQDLGKDNPKILSDLKTWFTNYKKNNFVEFIRYGSEEEAYNLVLKASKHYKRLGIKIK